MAFSNSYYSRVFNRGSPCEIGTPVKVTVDGVEVDGTLHKNLGTVKYISVACGKLGQPNRNGDVYPVIPDGCNLYYEGCT